jgi:uncharacterized membrane protein YfcA
VLSCIGWLWFSDKDIIFWDTFTAGYQPMSTLPDVLNLTVTTFILALSGSFVLGLSKSGIKGIGVLIVTLMALAFGARQSTGTLVPLLICGDIFAVVYYNRHARWEYIRKFLPWILLGIFFGMLIGKDLPEKQFKWAMAGIIMFSVLMMYWWDLRRSRSVPSHWAFAGFMGIMAGITTMIGNLAGAFSNIYFLAMRLPKNVFIGTAAWLFLLINLVKLPLHIFVWETITFEVIQTNLYLLPALLAGLFAGIRLVKWITDSFYRKMILILTAAGAVILLFR